MSDLFDYKKEMSALRFTEEQKDLLAKAALRNAEMTTRGVHKGKRKLIAAALAACLAAVNELPAGYRTVIYLFYYEGYQAAEIGKILGVPTATVHTRLARGRARLKDILGGTDYERSV